MLTNQEIKTHEKKRDKKMPSQKRNKTSLNLLIRTYSHS